MKTVGLCESVNMLTGCEQLRLPADYVTRDSLFSVTRGQFKEDIGMRLYVHVHICLFNLQQKLLN